MKRILVTFMLIATLFSATSCISKEITVSGYEVKSSNQEQGIMKNILTTDVSMAFPDYTMNGHVDKSLEEDLSTYKNNLLPLNVLPLDYTYELAKGSGNVVIHPSELIYNLDEVNNFMTHTQMGIKDYIRIAFFNDKGIPVLMDLEYDGFIIILKVDKSRMGNETDGVEKIIYDKITLEVESNPENDGNLISYVLSSNDNEDKHVLFQFPEINP
ncbi:DUF4362 domain-containing protein [Oceanirhabdus sp. W0125-5]|uniref:DUF4362 domain-containing protein n=1 Tax=Oceanirhabdus sp. W0125-5 TaxID=2999116 RepID=UPI0022F2E4E8|nr:DUF4362 domain-containing protein [Oceanirhabdus sp. W0125-5]WBW95296.1 DUF4362 domain-containing protein [Oceanirhabdus sp. W0125-5]